MDDKLNILLNSERNINSVNVDTFTKVNLDVQKSKINEYNVRNVLSVNELFELEREENQIYRIYGGLEYVSLLDGLSNDYTAFKDFFNPVIANRKNIFNSFDFYLVRPSDEEYLNISGLDEQVDEDTEIVVLDENFDNWSGGVPVGWNYTPGVGGDIEQAAGNRLRVNLADNPILNLVIMSREIPPTSGNVTVETLVDVLPEFEIGDRVTISFEYFVNDTLFFLDSRNTIISSDGLVRYTFNIPPNTPATRITLWFGSRNKSILMDYLKITSVEGGDIVYGVDNPPLNFPTTIHRRSFKVLTKLNNFELHRAGFSKNVFNDTKYIYNFNVDFDVSEYLDGFGMPLTELFLYAQYKPTQDESLTFENWTIDGDVTTNPYTPKVFDVGDILTSHLNVVIGDLVEFSRPNFYQRLDTPQTFRISTPITEPFATNIIWRYNPFIPIRLRYFEDYLNVVNNDSDLYDDLESIPNYAFELNNGDMIWKNIMPEGYIDPLTGTGTNHPFVNKRRYNFNNLVLDINPDLNDFWTIVNFQNIWFDRNIIPINTLPISDIGDINKPC